METLVWVVIYILVACVIAGVLTWIVRTAPFIPAEFKQIIVWVIWVVVALFFMLWLLQSFHGGGFRRPF